MISMKKTSDISIEKRLFSASLVKPIIAASTILLIDKFYFKNHNMKSNLYFAGSVGAGIFLSSSVGEMSRNLFPTNTSIGSLGKNLEGRVVEVICGSGSVYAMNRFILKNEYKISDMIPRIIAIGVSDIIAETVTEIIMRS